MGAQEEFEAAAGMNRPLEKTEPIRPSPLGHSSASTSVTVSITALWLTLLGVGAATFAFGIYVGNEYGEKKGFELGREGAYREDKYLKSFKRDWRQMQIEQLRAEIAAQSKALEALEKM